MRPRITGYAPAPASHRDSDHGLRGSSSQNYDNERVSPTPYIGAGQALALIVLGVTLAACGGVTWKRLELRELRALPVPPEFEVGGAVLGEGGEVLAWGMTRPAVLHYTRSGAPSIIDVGSHEKITAAAFVDGDSTFEVLFGANGRIVRLSMQGVIRQERYLAPWVDSAAVLAAARGRHGWITVAREPGGDLAVRSEDAAGGATPLMTVRHRLPAGGMRRFPLSAHVVASEADAILSTWWPPYEVAIIKGNGRHASMTLAAPDRKASQGDSVDQPMVALPRLPLDRGFLQTFADLQGDLREIVIFDRSGTERRRTRISASLGFTASAPRARRLLAVRRVQGLELVMYGWSWR